jgi:hypothetical protein
MGTSRDRFPQGAGCQVEKLFRGLVYSLVSLVRARFFLSIRTTIGPEESGAWSAGQSPGFTFGVGTSADYRTDRS